MIQTCCVWTEQQLDRTKNDEIKGQQCLLEHIQGARFINGQILLIPKIGGAYNPSIVG